MFIINKIFLNGITVAVLFILILLTGGWDGHIEKQSRVDRWERLNNYFVFDMIEYKGDLVFCSKQGIFSLTEKLHSQPAQCLATDGNIIVAGTNYGVLVFDSTWKKVELFQNGLRAQVRVIKNYNKLFFLGHTEGSYGVSTWHPEKGILYQHDFHAYIRSIEVHDTSVYAGDQDGIIWISENSGKSFDSTIYLDNQHLAVRSIKWINDDMLIGAGWIFRNFEKTKHYITPMDFNMNFVLSGDQGVFIYDDKMNNLIPFNEGLDDLRVSRLLLYDGNLYVGTVTGLFKRPFKQ
jgi:ligand-binding sensor domain-containing protein